MQNRFIVVYEHQGKQHTEIVLYDRLMTIRTFADKILREQFIG